MDVTTRCICPARPDGSQPHTEDTFKLRDTLSFREAVTYKKVVQMHQGEAAEMLASMTEMHLFVGLEAWSLVDAKGYSVPVDREQIEAVLLPQLDVAMAIADAADNLYMPTILPLVTRGTISWRPTPTASSTSPAPEDGDSPTPTQTARSSSSASKTSSKPSKRSSTTSTPTVATGPMPASPGVGSSTWQS